MADIKWTPEQEAAISAPIDEPAVVSAAAGSGKTALLVERVVRKLRDMNENIPADKIAIMTFTKNAAAEFRQRMSAAIEKAADGVSTKEERDYLSSQLIKFRGAPIETINAFALRLLKESPDLFGLPYNFSIIEEGKARILRRKALEAVLDYFYSDKYDAASREQLFKTFSFKDDEALTEHIIKIYNAVTSLPDRTTLMQSWCDAYTDEAKFCKLFLNDVIAKYDQLYNSLVKAIANMQSYRDSINSIVTDPAKNGGDADTIKICTDSVKSMDTIIKNDTAALNTFTKLYNDAKTKTDIELVAALLNLCFYEADPNDGTKVRKPTVGYPKDDIHNAEFKAIRAPIANANKTINEILKPFDLKFAAPKNKGDIPKHLGDIAQSLRSDMQRQAVVVNAFLGLVMSFDKVYSQLKMDEGYVDFADCEKLLLEKLSTDEEYRSIMSKRYKCLIIDEFQDTNAIQFEIFRKLSDNGKNLFFVGDVKQAIYGFRGGDSSIMARLCNGGDGFSVKPLNMNFRSRREVIDTVNAMFCDFLTVQYGDVDYTTTGQLVPGASYPNTGTETEDYDALAQLAANGQQASTNTDSKNSSTPAAFDKEDYSSEIHILNYDESGNTGYINEARYTAAKIKLLVDNGFLVKGKDGLRPCGYGDFGILLRSKKHFAFYRRELELLGIPVSSERGDGYLDTDEISLIIDLLKIIDNPMLNQETAVVLMSPLYMFSLEDMTKLRLGLMGIDEDKANLAGIDLEPLKAQYIHNSMYHCINSAANGYKVYSSQNSKLPDDDNHEGDSPEQSAYEETIAKLREAGAIYVNPDGETDEALISEGCRKCVRFIDDLVKFRAFMANNSVESLIRRIFDDTDFLSLFSIYDDSEQRIANIRLLMRYVADFESSGGGSLSDFLRYTDTILHNVQHKKISDNVLNSASTSEGNVQSVKLMTFHASKGLEFPICIIAELEKEFNKSDTSGELVFHRDLGPALVDVDIDNLIKTTCYSYLAVAAAEKDKLIGEELRLLYVAMTRAREKLIMIMREKPTKLLSYRNSEYDEAIQKAKSPVKWVLNSLLRGYSGNLPGDDNAFRSGKLLGIKASRLNIYISSTPLDEPKAVIPSQNSLIFSAEPTVVERLTDTITAEYRYTEDTTARSKYVVTEVAHMISDNEKADDSDNHAIVYLKKPTFSDKSDGISGKVVGDAFHHTMEHYPFGTDISSSDAIKQLADSGKINPTEYDIIKASIGKIDVFLNSSLCRRMLAAESYEREYEFFAEVPARSIYVDADGDTAIQGRIDMFFTEADGIVLVDYKTDSKNTILKELPAYKKQLMIYSEILPLMTGKPVKEIYIYSFSLGMEIRVDTLTDEKYEELALDNKWEETLRKEAR